MNVLSKTTPPEPIVMEKYLPQIDKDLVDYYNTLITHITGKENVYKNELINSVVSYYYANESKFNCSRAVRLPHFESKTKSIITLSLDGANARMFKFYCDSNNRSGKQEAEYILTVFLLTIKRNKVDALVFTEDYQLKMYKKKRIFFL